MRIVLFGLSISSAWGNGHATLLRGLCRELHARGHQLHFLERDVPYYAAHRDALSFPYVDLHLYQDWDSNLPLTRQLVAGADAAIITSYCPDAVAASELVLGCGHLRSVFYDMDTPVTLERLMRGEEVSYLPPAGLGEFDLVLSYTGGDALCQLRDRLGARHVAPLYGWVDPQIHHRVTCSHRVTRASEFAADLSYLGTYAADRQSGLDALLLQPAAQLPGMKFVVAGAMYQGTDLWPANVRFLDHVPPSRHASFYSSSALTLSVTRSAMAGMGYCPSGRLFEAAACGTPVLSDWWEGLDAFFKPDSEILIARSTPEAIRYISASRGELMEIGARAREKALDCHTAAVRAERLLQLIETPPSGVSDEAVMLASAER